MSGVLAVDDLAIFEGDCETAPLEAKPNKHDCSFSAGNSTCSWDAVNPGATSGVSLRPQDWKVVGRHRQQQQQRQQLFSDQFNDHTFGIPGGGFLFFDTANIQTMTWLVSDVFEANRSHCVNFWFAAPAAAAIDSKLVVKRQYSNGTSSILWEMKVSSMKGASMLGKWVPAQLAVNEEREKTLVSPVNYSRSSSFLFTE